MPQPILLTAVKPQAWMGFHVADDVGSATATTHAAGSGNDQKLRMTAPDGTWWYIRTDWNHQLSKRPWLQERLEDNAAAIETCVHSFFFECYLSP